MTTCPNCMVAFENDAALCPQCAAHTTKVPQNVVEAGMPAVQAFATASKERQGMMLARGLNPQTGEALDPRTQNKHFL